MTAFVALSLAGCATLRTTRDPEDLAPLLEALRKQGDSLAAQREARLQQGISSLEVLARPDGSLVARVDLTSAALPVVLRRLLDSAKAQYLFRTDIPSIRITARFDGIELVAALNLLLSPRGLACVRQGNILVIGTADDFAQNTTAPQGPAAPASPSGTGAESSSSSGDQAGSSTLTAAPAQDETTSAAPGTSQVHIEVPLNYIDAATAASLLDGLYPASATDGTRAVQYGQIPSTNTLELMGGGQDVSRAARILRQVDSQPGHVLIEALVIEFDAESYETIEADIQKASFSRYSDIASSFGSLAGTSLIFTSSAGLRNPTVFTAVINILLEQNKARLISRPFIATMSGKPATIDISNDRFVIVQEPEQGATIATPHEITSGVTMTITPTVMPDGMIRMDLDVVDSQFVPTVENVAAEVDKNHASSTMQVESGQTIVIGGLALNRQAQGRAGVPILSRIPIVGALFGNQSVTLSRQEVILYLTPHLWDPSMDLPIQVPRTFSVRGMW
ncbi:MAG: hypothetical protein HYX75_21095 [Acidobacteria bacterium]|nr:hypothetical protein [Acidobacteriota bacterium]